LLFEETKEHRKRGYICKKQEGKMHRMTKGKRQNNGNKRGGSVVQIHCCILQDEFFYCNFFLVSAA
jgi:hypothetical protein